MPLDITAQVRSRISDRLRYGEESRGGDGLGSVFKLAQGAPASTLTAASAYVQVAAGWSATGATFNTDIGTVTFQSAISANSAWRVDYQWSVFSQDEITNFLSVGGSVPAAALEAVRALMFDGLRRARWAAPDGSNYDDTAALAQLQKLYDQIWAELREGPAGGFQSWTQEQKNYWGDYNA
jgi:hypothetical protein